MYTTRAERRVDKQSGSNEPVLEIIFIAPELRYSNDSKILDKVRRTLVGWLVVAATLSPCVIASISLAFLRAEEEYDCDFWKSFDSRVILTFIYQPLHSTFLISFPLLYRYPHPHAFAAVLSGYVRPVSYVGHDALFNDEFPRSYAHISRS